MNICVANILYPVLHMLFQYLTFVLPAAIFIRIFIYCLLQTIKRKLSGGMNT